MIKYSTWNKVDIHIHSKKSNEVKENDYKGDEYSGEQLLDKMLEDNINVNIFSITDHNCINEVLYKEIESLINADKYKGKVNYIIYFKYKDTIGSIAHYKLSYRLKVEEKVKKEILIILNEVKTLLEKALLKFSEEAVKNNKYSLSNHFELYKEKLDLLEQNILNIPKRINSLEEEEKEKKHLNLNIFEGTHKMIKNKTGKYETVETEYGTFLNKYWTLERNLNGELSYTIELYIENWFAFIEHIFSLLFPMTSYYNSDAEYSDYLSKDWRKKAEEIFGDNNNFKLMIEQLPKIKEIYRNRFSHGMFSREKKINVQIKGFGMYPLWIGKKHCRGFNGSENILTLKIFEKVKRIFKKFYEEVKQTYKLQFNLIENHIPTFLDTALYEIQMKKI